MRFLVDAALSPQVGQTLCAAGHDAVHVRDFGLQTAPDDMVLDLALRERRVLVSADADFATLLAIRGSRAPSIALFRRSSPRRPEAQGALILANLASVAPLLERGSVVVFEQTRIRVRLLPIAGRSDES